MKPVLQRVAPVLVVRDVVASVAFWKEKVGFSCDELFGSPPNFAMPYRDGVTLMLAQAPDNVTPPVANWRVISCCNQAYIWVDDVSALYAEVLAMGAPIDFSLYDTPWGTREFGIQDLDEHDICFGQVTRVRS